MFLFVVRALFLSWPFLKRAIFGDQSFKDFLLKNKQLTVIFITTIFLSLLLLYAMISYSQLKQEHDRLNYDYKELIQCKKIPDE